MDLNNSSISGANIGAKLNNNIEPNISGPKKINFLILAAVVLIVIVLLLVGLFLYLNSNKKEAQLSDETVSAGFGAQLLLKAQNPIADKLPETNPFEKDINPLENVYQNPF